MNTDEIRYFLAMCNSESISHAAEDLHITPQGLGASLRRFEKKLGVTLFVRTSSGTIPTESARFLQTRFRDMVAIEDEVIRYLDDLNQVGRARKAIGRDSALGDAIALGIGKYSANHPDTPVSVQLTRTSEDVIAKKFIEEGFDYRFCSTEVDALPELPRELLCRLQFIPVVGKKNPMAKKGTFELSDLKHYTVLTENSTFVWTRILVLRCAEHGFEPRIREVDHDYLIRLLEGSSDAVSFVKDVDLSSDPWNSDRFVTLECLPNSALGATIVMQTTRPQTDRELAASIRERLGAFGYTTL